MSRKYIAAGFRQDMELLFSRFLDIDQQNGTQNETQSQTQTDHKPKPLIRLRFRRFCQIWRELSFSLIFKGRLNDNELREFIDEIYLEVLSQLTSDKPFERRVSSLYLLYSLFVKQPQNKDNAIEQKIRINFSYLEQIRQLVAKAKQLEQFDVCYIWYKLLSLGAVHLVHVSRLMGPYYIRNSRVTAETETYTDFLIDQFKESMLPSVDELSHIHEEYRKMKEALIEEKVQDMNEVNQIQDNVFELYKAKMDNLQKEFANQIQSQESQSNQFQFDEEFYESNLLNGSQESEDIGSRRRKIKDKAMAKGNTAIVSPVIQSNDGTNQVKRRRGRPKKCKLN